MQGPMNVKNFIYNLIFYVSTNDGFGIAPKHVATYFKITFSCYCFPRYILILLPLAKDWVLSDTEGSTQ